MNELAKQPDQPLDNFAGLDAGHAGSGSAGTRIEFTKEHDIDELAARLLVAAFGFGNDDSGTAEDFGRHVSRSAYTIAEIFIAFREQRRRKGSAS